MVHCTTCTICMTATETAVACIVTVLSVRVYIVHTKLPTLSNLLYVVGNTDYADSQRQAAITLQVSS